MTVDTSKNVKELELVLFYLEEGFKIFKKLGFGGVLIDRFCQVTNSSGNIDFTTLFSNLKSIVIFFPKPAGHTDG